MLLLTPVPLLTTLRRPFSVGRLVFTYLFPTAIPPILFDSLVSYLRSYTQSELEALTRGLETADYAFEIGVKRSHGQPLTYLVGRMRSKEMRPRRRDR